MKVSLMNKHKSKKTEILIYRSQTRKIELCMDFKKSFKKNIVWDS